MGEWLVQRLWDMQQYPANLMVWWPPARMGSSKGHTTKLKQSRGGGLTGSTACNRAWAPFFRRPSGLVSLSRVEEPHSSSESAP
jgi:hypothetical protein